MSSRPFPGPALLAVVALGAVAGALARWGLGEQIPDTTAWPSTLWAINVVGSGLLGFITGWAGVRDRPLLAAALGPGVLGGFTSVSAAAEDVRVLLQDDRMLLAGAWWGSMLVASVLAVLLGRATGARLDGGAS